MRAKILFTCGCSLGLKRVYHCPKHGNPIDLETVNKEIFMTGAQILAEYDRPEPRTTKVIKCKHCGCVRSKSINDERNLKYKTCIQCKMLGRK